MLKMHKAGYVLVPLSWVLRWKYDSSARPCGARGVSVHYTKVLYRVYRVPKVLYDQAMPELRHTRGKITPCNMCVPLEKQIM